MITAYFFARPVEFAGDETAKGRIQQGETKRNEPKKEHPDKISICGFFLGGSIKFKATRNDLLFKKIYIFAKVSQTKRNFYE